MPRDPLSFQQIRKSTKSRPTKFKGLGRLRWYCTACSKQCHDENGFDAIASNIRQILEEYSQQCLSTFLNLLRVNHGEKSVEANRFYQTYIADPHHVHLKDTRWGSLTLFVEWLGREGLCRCEKKDDGIYIAWIDTSPEAERQAAALRRKKRREAADRRQEECQLEEQVKRAHALAKHHDSPSPTQPASLDPTPDGDATVAFRFNPQTTSVASRTARPKKQRNIFKTAGRKRGIPVHESAELQADPQS